MNQPSVPFQRSRLTSMAGATLLGMPFIAWVIARFNDDIDLIFRWTGPDPIWYQLIVGVPVGVLAALGAKFIVSRKYMEGVRLRYARMFKSLRLNWSEIIFISMCAGVGEELLFRGVLQPMMGIWLTSFVFVAIHGYINPKDWRISTYGVYMTAVIVVLGFMTEIIGIWSAVMAHFIIDVILLHELLEKPGEVINDDSVQEESDEVD